MQPFARIIEIFQLTEFPTDHEYFKIYRKFIVTLRATLWWLIITTCCLAQDGGADLV